MQVLCLSYFHPTFGAENPYLMPGIEACGLIVALWTLWTPQQKVFAADDKLERWIYKSAATDRADIVLGFRVDLDLTELA